MKPTKQRSPNRPAEAGQGFVEYALILILVGIAVVLVVSLMQPAIGDVFSRFVAQAPVAPPSLLNYTPPPTFTSTPTEDPSNPNPPDPPPADTATATATSTATSTATATATATSANPTATPTCPYGPHQVPAGGSVRVQMQNFRCGGAGVAFSDQTNDGGPGSGMYRSDVGSEGPDLQNTSDSGGGYNVGYTRNGEWLEYEVIAPVADSYTFVIRFASQSSSPQLRIITRQVETGYQADTGNFSLGVTGGWQSWQNHTRQVALFQGTNIVRVHIASAGGNYNYIDIQPFVPTATATPLPTATATQIPTSTPTAPPPISLTLRSDAGYDGYVRASNSNNNSGSSSNTISTGNIIYVGDDSGDRQYIGIVSFDTSAIPTNATIISVQLRLMRQDMIRNPFGDQGMGTLYADIGLPNGFNGNYALQRQDFQAPAAASNVISFSQPASNGQWASGMLGAGHYNYVNRNNHTQFKIHFEYPSDDDGREDQFLFYSGNASLNNRPQLIVTYTVP